MRPMQVTIDENDARKMDRDRRVFGAAFARVDADGKMTHIPAERFVYAPNPLKQEQR